MVRAGGRRARRQRRHGRRPPVEDVVDPVRVNRVGLYQVVDD